MAVRKEDDILKNLPLPAAEYIRLVIKKMRYRKKVRSEVMAELAGHFEDELKDCKTEEEKEQKAKQLIEQFGDPKLLSVLLRRAKKRCRPLWKKVLVQTSKIIGLLFLYIVIRLIFLATGSPSINTDYIEWLNKLVAAGRPEAENARMNYNKAAELYVKMPAEIVEKSHTLIDTDFNKWFADLNDLQRETFTKWLADNQQSFEAFRQGSEKPYYWPIYEGQKSGQPLQGNSAFYDTNMWSKRRVIAQAMKYQIIYDEYEGKEVDALNDCLILLRYGTHLEGKGLLNEQLVGIAIEALAINSTSRLLQKQDIPIDTLKDFRTRLESIICNAGPILTLEVEKAFWYDLIQRGFTDDGKGNGRALSQGLPLVTKDALNSITGFFFWNFPDRRECTATIDDYFAKAGNLLEKSPYELHQKGESQIWNELGKQSVMLKLLGPVHGRVGEWNWRIKAQRTALRTIISLLIYEKEKGSYPTNLDELVSSGFLKSLPMDPWSDKPLVYKKTETGFTLYSVGLNFKDDGGVMGTDEEGKPRMWAENGDWVFWPVAK